MSSTNKNENEYFFLDSFCKLHEIIEVLDQYSLDEFQLFMIQHVIDPDLYDALQDYLIIRINDYLSIK